MARFEGALYVGGLGFKTEPEPASKDFVHKVGEGQVCAILTCDEGSVEVRLGRSETNETVLDMWVVPQRTLLSDSIGKRMWSGPAAEFFQGIEKLIQLGAREMLEEAFNVKTGSEG